MGNQLHGTAEFVDWEGLEKEKALRGGGLILGYPFTESGANTSKLLVTRPQRHFLSVAPTRSGKGVSLIIPNLLQYRGSAIVIDPKGENAWVTAQYRHHGMKQKVFVLDPWNEVNRRYGDLIGLKQDIARFNPLSILDPKSQHYADDLAYLADAIIMNQNKGDPFFDESARELVAGLMAFTVEVYGEEASLPMVRDMLSKPAHEVASVAEEAQGLDVDSVARRKLGRFTTDSKTNASIIATALAQTSFLDSAALGESLKKSDFSFDDLVNGHATIYLVLPVDKLQTYGRWLRLMVSIGIRTVARNEKPLGVPVLFVLDEFGTIGRLSAVAQAYGLMAGLQMCIWAFVQDLVQLKRDYPDEWETFIGNSELVTFFNLMDQFSCDYFSRALGTRTVEVISKSTAEARQGGMFKPADPTYSQMSDQLYGRALLQPAEIRALKDYIGIIISRQFPSHFVKVFYHHDDDFLVRARADPHFPDMAVKIQKLVVARKLEERAKAIPDLKAAKAQLEKFGYKTESSGVISKKYTISTVGGRREEFADANALLHWVRENLL